MARARNQRGEGCYDKLIDKDGKLLFYRWRVGIYDPVDKKTRYKSIKAKSRAALDKKVKEWKETNGDRSSLPPLPKRITIQQWVKRWLAMLENRIAQATYARYRDTAEHHILPHFGSLWISEVTPLMLQEYFDKLLETYALATVSTIRGHFRACFSKAVKYEILSRTPVVSTDPPKGEKPTLKVLEESEISRILAVARDCTYRPPARGEGDEYIMKRDYLIILLAVSSGMRKGEILGLTWPCVNGTQIEVKHSLQANLIGVKRKLKDTKNGKPRTITIPESVAKKTQRVAGIPIRIRRKIQRDLQKRVVACFYKCNWHFG